MEFMVIRKADADTEAGAMPTKQLIDDMTAYNARLVASGAMKSGAGLLASAHGARVSFANGKPTVVDGPFTEAKELVAGYSIIEAGSLAEVIEMIKDWPASDGRGNVQIEIRPLATAESLGFDEEQRARYERVVQQQMQQ